MRAAARPADFWHCLLVQGHLPCCHLTLSSKLQHWGSQQWCWQPHPTPPAASLTPALPAGGSYPNAGTPAFADTPGTVNPSPAGMGYGGQYMPSPAGYAPSPAGYQPSPAGYAAAGTPAVAGTPGMYAPAGTPGMYAAAGTPGVYGADGPAPTPGGGQQYGGGPPPPPGINYSNWVDVEVMLPGGEHAVVRSVEGATATVALGREEGERRWSYPPDAPTRSGVPVGDMQLVAPDRKDAVRIVSGELAGQYGELVGTDVADGIVKLGGDIKIYQLTVIGRLAVQSAGEAAPPPPPPA